MDGFEKIARVGEITSRRPKRVLLEKFEVVIFRVDQRIYAVENNCPHQHFALLHQGNLEGCNLTCPMHGWTFDLSTGQATNGNGRLRKFEVRILNDEVWVEKPTGQQIFTLFE